MAQTEVDTRTVIPPLQGARRRLRGTAIGVAVGVTVTAAAGAVLIARHGGESGFVPPTTPEEKIASAMLAAPSSSISQNATVLDWKAKASDPYPLLRKGTNGWTCFPDAAATPAEDPGCFDSNTMAWADAYYAGTTPKLKASGISYWFRGTSDASWTDPAAMTPPPGQDWAFDGPHLTIVPVDPTEVTASSTGGHHDARAPMAMWAGTPYAHWHVPLG